jgi:hypothetical protein
MLPFIPEEPEVPEDQRGEAELGVRFEDICQDGRLRIDGVWPPLGRILWNEARMGRVFAGLGKSGIWNVLARLVIHAEDVPISPRRRSLNRVLYQLAHTVDERGEVNRIVLRNWLRTDAVPARSPAGVTERRPVARAYGLHVFTRPLAAADQRRVVSLEGTGLPPVPETRIDLPAPRTLLQAPPGATFLDALPRPDTAPLVFGPKAPRVQLSLEGVTDKDERARGPRIDNAGKRVPRDRRADDTSVAAGVLDLLRGLLAERDVAAVVVSHDFAVIEALTDRSLVMQLGRVVERGLTDQLFRDPHHPYTQRLVAAARR